MTQPLDGRIALVTGAGGRLGPIWVKALEAAGAIVVACDRDPAFQSSRTQYSATDVTNPSQMEAMSTRILHDHGPVSILVNNAGVDSRPVPGLSSALMYLDMVRVNILGTDLATRTFHHHFNRAGGGSVINIASLYGLVAPDLRYYDHRADRWVKDPIYGATKAAIISLTKYYAAAWAPEGIRVNALAPGGVVAPGDALTAQDPQFVAKYTNRIPMGRMASPEDLGGPLVFLASDASSFVTGQCLAIDGGYVAW
jgi:NAD(P)-dependent dehydrogenase (short-subunit alcohol dehydrogenase family)